MMFAGTNLHYFYDSCFVTGRMYLGADNSKKKSARSDNKKTRTAE